MEVREGSVDTKIYQYLIIEYTYKPEDLDSDQEEVIERIDPTLPYLDFTS